MSTCVSSCLVSFFVCNCVSLHETTSMYLCVEVVEECMSMSVFLFFYQVLGLCLCASIYVYMCVRAIISNHVCAWGEDERLCLWCASHQVCVFAIFMLCLSLKLPFVSHTKWVMFMCVCVIKGQNWTISIWPILAHKLLCVVTLGKHRPTVLNLSAQFLGSF